MSNFVFISPNFPEAYRWFCIRLRENGVNVLGVGDASYDELHPDLKRALTEYRPGDAVIIAGKGHEDYQIIGTVKQHFDDRETALQIIEQEI